MGLQSYKVSVPGSLMLFGEHAVLHNKRAIVTAVDYYITNKLTPRFDNNIEIRSSVFGQHRVSIDRLKITQPFTYVLAAIKQFLTKIKIGFTLDIQADFPADIGFGSSAAVTVATLSVLYLWLMGKPIARMKLYRQAVSVVRAIQGFGSGADVAASVFGGVVAYKMDPIMIKKISNSLPLVVAYSGKKVLTSVVVAEVEKKQKKFPTIFSDLYNVMDLCTREAILAIKNRQWRRLGMLMNIHQGLQDALGVNNAVLSELVFSLRSYPHIYGAKISGAGLGDCVVGLGRIKK